jgi:hypothetical protein
VSNRIVFRLTYLLVSLSLEARSECYCFPTFKDLRPLPATPFFERECKGKSLFIFTKFFMIYFPTNLESFSVKINLFSKELYSFFFERTAKIGVIKMPANFLSLIEQLDRFFFRLFFRELPVFSSGDAKIGRIGFTDKNFLEKMLIINETQAH